MKRDTAKMREYWEQRAQINPAYYVDTDLDFDNPDMQQFMDTGRRIATMALDEPPAVAPPGKALAVEIGCGMGRICLALGDRFDRVVGYDISAEMLRRARELVPDERFDFRLTDGASLPQLSDGSADLVLTFTVFQHIPSLDVIRSYVQEAGRALRPGGMFVLQWNGTPGAARWRWFRMRKSLEHRLGRGDQYGRDAPQFLGSRVELEDMRAMLASAGMTLLATTGEGTLFTWGWARKN